MSKVHDVIIVGAGPAGLSAAVYASRAGLSTVIIPGETAGGLLTTTEKIDNYLGLFGSTGEDMAENFLKHAQEFGASFQEAQTVVSITKKDDVFSVKTDFDQEYFAKSVVYAAGSTPRKLGVNGEDTSGVSYCATCDGIFFEDEDVIVVGGGETAAEDALYLSGIAKSVTVLVRSFWRATQPAVDKLESQENVNILSNISVSEILEKDGEIESVKAVEADGTEVIIPANGVFVAVGQIPQSHIAHDNDFVSVYENGFIRSSHTDGFFVAGDVSDPDYRQVAVAVGSGAVAGIDATKFIIGA